MPSFELNATQLLLPNSSIGLEQPSWFALQTRPRYEKKIHTELLEKGIETFLPLWSTRHRWSDRQQLVHLPLFPGYLFVHIAASSAGRVSVLRTNGVIAFVGARNVGAPIPDSEIAAVRTILEQRIPFQPYPYLKIGQHVCIRSGCLQGVTGVLMAINGDESLIVSINLIQRSIAMRIDGFKIEPM